MFQLKSSLAFQYRQKESGMFDRNRAACMVMISPEHTQIDMRHVRYLHPSNVRS
jgi:hypothetical protein